MRGSGGGSVRAVVRVDDGSRGSIPWHVLHTVGTLARQDEEGRSCRA
jgi:hypothetical protein